MSKRRSPVWPSASEAPFDPLTGQAITALPARVKANAERSLFNRCDEAPQEVMAQQLSKIKQLMRQAEELSEDEDYKRRWAKAEKHEKGWAETMAYIDAPATAIGT